MKRAAFVVALMLLAGCAKTIPADSYGVRRLRIEGMEQLDDAALQACLATGPRERVGIDFGTSSELTCNRPPFDGGRLRLNLWSWWWTPWPTFDGSLFERDLERIERWFRARGFYEARVERTTISPPAAAVSDEIPRTGAAPCTRQDHDEGCTVDITVRVTEGRPVLVRSVTVEGLEAMDPIARRTVERTRMLEVGDRWDETLYDDAKQALVDSLREAGFACVTVQGRVDLAPEAHTADLHYTIEPGPQAVFGNVTIEVENNDPHIPKKTVLSVAGIDRGERYAPSSIVSAQNAIYALGAFGAVEVVATPRRHAGGESSEAPSVCEGVVDVSIRVTPGRRLRWGLGGGFQSGTVRPGGLTGGATTNQAIWDVHLISFVEHRNLFGGLRRLRIEERPKLVFQHPFPVTLDPRPGNELRVDFRQPAFLERRTLLEINARSDLGPDPWNRNYRHAIDASIGVRRTFWQERILAGLSFHASHYNANLAVAPHDSRCPTWDLREREAALGQPTCAHRTPDHRIFFLEQYVQFDRRNDARSPRKGVLLSIDAHEGGFAGLSSWKYFRVIPDFRFFIPLPWNLVIAGRFGLGMAWISNPAKKLTEPVVVAPDRTDPANLPGYSTADNGDDPYRAARELGPTQYRLRGGGANDNRGFGPGQLGDVACPGGMVVDDDGNVVSCGDATKQALTEFQPIDGGLRKWIASLELRAHLTESFGVVAFADMGDVNRDPRFRFNRTNLSLGMGIRYDTIVGPLRLDIGWRVPGAAGGHGTDGFGNSVRCNPRGDYVTGCPPPQTGLPIVFNITIGEAF